MIHRLFGRIGRRHISAAAIALAVAVWAQPAAAATSVFVSQIGTSGNCQINAIGDSADNVISFQNIQGELPGEFRVRVPGGTVSVGTGCTSLSSTEALCSSCVTSLCCSNIAVANSIFFFADGNDGDDTLTNYNGYFTSIEGGNGDDTIIGGLGTDFVSGEAGDDTFFDLGCGVSSATVFGVDLLAVGNADFDIVFLNQANYNCIGSVQLGTQ